MTLPIDPAIHSDSNAPADEVSPATDASVAPRSTRWKMRLAHSGRWALARSPWLVRRLPRAMLNLLLVLVIVILLLACWVPGWMGAVTDRERVNKPPRRTMHVPAVQRPVSERPQV